MVYLFVISHVVQRGFPPSSAAFQSFMKIPSVQGGFFGSLQHRAFCVSSSGNVRLAVQCVVSPRGPCVKRIQ